MELLNIESEDPFGVGRQIEAFHSSITKYPIALLKYQVTQTLTKKFTEKTKNKTRHELQDTKKDYKC